MGGLMHARSIEKLRPIMAHGKPDTTTARGRNGWFRLHRLDLSVSPATQHRGERIDIDGESRQGWRNCPQVHLELHPTDAKRLWVALGTLLGIKPCVCGAGDSCPNCHA
jgi:hypothetical protein